MRPRFGHALGWAIVAPPGRGDRLGRGERGAQQELAARETVIRSSDPDGRGRCARLRARETLEATFPRPLLLRTDETGSRVLVAFAPGFWSSEAVLRRSRTRRRGRDGARRPRGDSRGRRARTRRRGSLRAGFRSTRRRAAGRTGGRNALRPEPRRGKPAQRRSRVVRARWRFERGAHDARPSCAVPPLPLRNGQGGIRGTVDPFTSKSLSVRAAPAGNASACWRCADWGAPRRPREGRRWR